MPSFDLGPAPADVITQGRGRPPRNAPYKVQVDRFYLLAPPLLLLAFLCLTFVIYCALCALGKTPDVGRVKHNQFFGLYMARYLVWVIGPVERLLVGRVSPNAITAVSLAMCGACGVAAGLGNLGAAVWLYTFAGILDIVDGRIARLQNKQTTSGALFDSVSDRWGELFIFTGYAWFLRDTIWLLAVMAAIGSSMMVSYTRARAEGLQVELSGGLMQRAERIFLVVVGTLLAAWYGAADSASAASDANTILGGTMALCAIASTATALGRWIAAYRILAKRDAEKKVASGVIDSSPLADTKSGQEPVRPAEIFAPVPKALRESAELPL
jgi:CDP-diacylglycerol---glycerol-3-phosphate 3-phosphatidyltransferase